MSDFNYTEMLDWRKAHIESREARGQLNDAVVTVSWDRVPLAALSGAADWLKANRSNVSTLYGDHQTITGTYRLDTTRPGTNSIFAVYRLDHDTALDWTNARIIGGAEHATSDRYFRVRFPSINVDNAVAIASSVKGSTFANPLTIGQESVAGTHRCLASSVQWSEDTQSADLILTIGDPEFTLVSFADYALPDERTITYLWNVPKEDAATLIAGYQTTGASVTVSHSMQSDIDGTVDLTVSQIAENAAIAQDITVGTNCDTVTLTKYRWGLTEADMLIFVAQYEIQEAGVEKQLSVSFNQSTGKYNVIGTTSTRSLSGVTLTYTIGSSEDDTTTVSHRWNLTQEGVEAFVAEYATQEEGKEKRVNVSRRDSQCVYDAVGFVIDANVTIDPLSLVIGLTGLSYEAREYRWNLSRASLMDFAASYATRTSGEVKRLDVSRRNGLFNVVGSVVTSLSSSAATTHGTYSERETFSFSYEVTEQEKDALIAALADDDTTVGNRSVSVSRNGNDTYTVSVRITRRKPDTKSVAWTVGAVNHTLTVYVGYEQQDVDAILEALDKTDIDYSIRMDRANDGTWDLAIRASSNPGDAFSAIVGTSVEQTTHEFYWEITKAQVTGYVAALGNDSNPGGKRFSLSYRGGKFNLTIEHTTQKNVDFSDIVTAIGTDFSETETLGYGKLQTDLAVLSQEEGVARRLSVSRDEQGYLRSRLQKRTVTAWTGQTFVLQKTVDGTWNAYDYRNYVNPPTLSTTYGRIVAVQDPETGLYSGRVAEYSPGISFDGDGWDNYTHTGNYAYRMQRVNDDGTTYEVPIRVTYDVLQTQSHSDAEDFLNYSQNGNVRSYPGSDIQIVRGDRYRVIRVTAIEVYTGSNYDTSGWDNVVTTGYGSAAWVSVK